MKRHSIRFLVATAALTALGLFPAAAQAGQIDLSTVPPREEVALTIYKQADLTLVRERRTISVHKGKNPLQFSWAGTQIDPSSVTLRFREHAEKLRILGTRYDHERSGTLYWNVQSELTGRAPVEITYFTSGIDWEAQYELEVPVEDGAQSAWRAKVEVHNQSGEDYPNAKIRLVVGEVNLLEKIRALAQRGIVDRDLAEAQRREDVPEQAQERAERKVAQEAAFADSRAGEGAAKPKDVGKEQTSEYHVFAIEGRETIPDGWAKRIRAFEPVSPELEAEHRYFPERHGRQLMRVIVFENRKETGLGQAPLPAGAVQLYSANADQSLGYMGQAEMRYVPVGDEVELELGPDPQVKLDQQLTDLWRDDFVFREHNRKKRVRGWRGHRIWQERIENTHGHPIHVRIRRSFQGDALFRSELQAERHDVQTVEIEKQVSARSRAALPYYVRQAQGRQQTQRRLAIEKGPPPKR